MSLNHLLNPIQGQTLNIVVNSVRTDGALITKCTTDGKELDLTPPTIGNIGDVLTRVGSSGNVEFMPPPSSGGTVTNPLNSNLSIGAFDVVGLFGGQTLSSINATQIIQTQYINDSAHKVQNINNFTIPNLTVFDGVTRSDNFGADIVGDKLFLSKINLNTNTINIETDNLKFNGNPIATIGDIQTTTLSSVGTGDSIVYQDLGPNLSVKSLMSGDGIQVFSTSNTIEISSTDQPRITTLENKTQFQSAYIDMLNDTTSFTGIIQADTLKKTGGTSNQFLKANGTVDSNSYNNIQYLMNVSPPTLISSDIETTMNGTGLTTNNMSMTWTDAINYSRSIYISGTISHTVNTTLTIRFRVSGGTIIIGWPIILANSNVVNVPFTMFMNYTIKNNNLYTASCRYDEAGSVSGATHMYNATSSCLLGGYSRLITAQWGASSAQNSLSVQELIVKNNYVG